MQSRIPCLALAALCGVLPAQVFEGGDLMVADFSANAVWRIDAAGLVTRLPDGGLLRGPSGVVVTKDLRVVIADFSSSTLVLVDPNGQAFPLATVGSPIRITEDHDGTLLVASLANDDVVRVDRSGRSVSVFTMPTGSRPFDVHVDGDGAILVVDDRTGTLWRWSPALGLMPIHAGAPFRLPQGVALFPNGDYAVFDGLADAVFRVDRNTGQVSTWVSNASLGNNPCGIVESGDGGFFVSASSAAVSEAIAIDPSGAVSRRFADPLLRNAEDLARVPNLQGPLTMQTGPGVLRNVVMSVPTQPSKLYVMGLSGGLFPGLALNPGVDDRALMVTIDGLYLATVGAPATSFVTGFFGSTNGQGRAQMNFDFSPLQPGLLNGFTLWMQGFTLDATAPSGVGVITSVHPLAFR